MSGIGNKGKFNDRLKRMKLIRYAKKMKLKIGDYFHIEEPVEIKRKVIDGSSVVIAFLGGGISQLTSNNKSVDNEKVSKNIGISEDNISLGIVDNSKKDESMDENHSEKPSEFIRRKAVETASVGVALVGAVGVNLLGGDSAKVDILKKTSSIEDNSSKDISDNLSKKEIDFGNESKSSFQRVFRSGNDIILIDKISDQDIINGDKKTYLASQIIKKIKKEFERKLNEVEVLESELFLLNEKNENELDLEKCKEIRKQIEEVIAKINHLIEQYNIYQNSKFLNNMLDIDDHTLVDDISDFKRLYDGAEIQRRLVSDYELISKYQSLYGELSEVKNQVEQLSSKNENKIFDYDMRDKKYEDITNRIVDIERFEDDCKYYIKKQNEYIDDISSKVGKIDVSQIVNYRMQGFGDLIGGTLRYLSIMFRRPFSSHLGGITFQIYAADRMIQNLRSALRLEKITNTVYQVENFQFELSNKIHTLDYNYDNVSRTLDDVKKLREEFMEQYQYVIPGYNETLRKINDIESLVYQNQKKLDLIRNKLKMNKKLNEETLKKCRVLEKESQPYVERV